MEMSGTAFGLTNLERNSIVSLLQDRIELDYPSSRSLKVLEFLRERVSL